MILDNDDIKFCKRIIRGIGLKASLNKDNDVIVFTSIMTDIIDFYESHMNSWEYTSHHDRQAMSFIKRLAITDSKDKKYKYPEYFEDNFFHLIDDYPAIKQRYYEWLEGGNI